MATHKWKSSHVKNDYSSNNSTVINNITQITVDDVEVLTAEATETLINDSITAFQALISTDFDALAATVADNITNIATLSSEQGTLAAAIDTNTGNILSNFNSIMNETSTLSDAISAVETTAETNSTDLATHIGFYNNLVSLVGEHNNSITALQSKQTTDRANITTNTEDIASNVVAFDAHVVEFDALALKFTKLTT